MRAVLLTLLFILGGLPTYAQDLSALARVVPQETSLSQSRGQLTLSLGLSQGVPYRVYTLADPNQLVLELSEVDWAGLETEALAARDAGPVQVGALAPGWSGLVLDLGVPFVLTEAAFDDRETGKTLTLTLEKTSQEAFAAASGMPATSAAILRSEQDTAPFRDSFVVVIDPGHGGVDPGAERGGVRESDLMLMMAREFREGLRRIGGFDVYMTRDEDVFVSLPQRAALARRLNADAFISLHADALETGYAEGATAHTLAPDATSSASTLLTERVSRTEIVSGVDLGGQADEIARVLLDLARLDTFPRSERLALSIIDGLGDNGARLNSNPQRTNDFAVLRSADVPSVLVEVGFLSSDRDRIELQSPEKRDRIIQGLVDGLRSWAQTDRTERALLRQ